MTTSILPLILLLSYRSPVLWLFPVLSAFTALTGAQAVVYLLAEHAGVTVNAQTAGILLVLVFGASTDYALLIVARYREELRRRLSLVDYLLMTVEDLQINEDIADLLDDWRCGGRVDGAGMILYDDSFGDGG